MLGAARHVHIKRAGLTIDANQEFPVNRRIIIYVAAALALSLPSGLAFGQSATTSPSQSQQSAVPAAAGPTVAASTAGIRSSTASASTTAPPAQQDRNLGAGQNIALMVVGGAALVIGAVIGGTAGLLLAVGGAVVGLYGLYNFVQ